MFGGVSKVSSQRLEELRFGRKENGNDGNETKDEKKTTDSDYDRKETKRQ